MCDAVWIPRLHNKLVLNGLLGAQPLVQKWRRCLCLPCVSLVCEQRCLSVLDKVQRLYLWEFLNFLLWTFSSYRKVFQYKPPFIPATCILVTDAFSFFFHTTYNVKKPGFIDCHLLKLWVLPLMLSTLVLCPINSLFWNCNSHRISTFWWKYSLLFWGHNFYVITYPFSRVDILASFEFLISYQLFFEDCLNQLFKIFLLFSFTNCNCL